MPRVYTAVTDQDAQEDAIAGFVNKATGLKCYFEGYDFKRVRPYALANMINTRKEGKPWKTKTLENGITTVFKRTAFHNVDIDIYTDAYDELGAYLKESAKYYMQRFIDNFDFEDNKSDLKNQEMIVSLVSQNAVHASIKEEDKWIKQSSIECVFNYNHEYKITDSDTITDVGEIQLTMTE
jgi:hypothetical protein